MQPSNSPRLQTYFMKCTVSLKPFVSIFLLLWCNGTSAQISTDTLHINLDSAERLFLRGNFTLLAQKYNIQAQKAQEIQAKLYPNPNLSVFYSLYNTQTKKFFPTGNGVTGGEVSAQLSQLVYLAGQRNKQVKIAEANTRLA